MNMDFHGSKLLLCKTKEEFDNLTLEQIEGYDMAFYCKSQRRGGMFTNHQYQIEMILILNIVNKNLIRDDLQLDPYFCFLKKMYGECITGIYHKDITVNELFFIVDGGVIRCKAEMPKVVTSLPHATLYDIENQHWVCEKGNIHNIPKDKSVNIHEYYDVVENEENKTSFKWKLLNDEPFTEGDLNIKGDLNLNRSEIRTLPKGLKVWGNLDLYHSEITSLPEAIPLPVNTPQVFVQVWPFPNVIVIVLTRVFWILENIL
jgi:hypothetical protein